LITNDPERLASIATTLGDAIREAEAGKRVRLPVLQPADAAGLVMTMHAQLDAKIAERTAEAAQLGHHIACAAGCTACCASPLLVSAGEAVAVAAWLAGEPEIAAQFAVAYRAWKRGVGRAGEALQAARTDDDRQAAARTLRKQHVMCAFNREGLCTIYEARPARCRKVHALGTPDACGPEGDGQVQYFEHLATETTFAEQEPMRGALHHALHPHGGLELLCSAVYRMLHARSPRNAPCPCGSGKKHKHCCAD
jgi:hypothetical protein